MLKCDNEFELLILKKYIKGKACKTTRKQMKYMFRDHAVASNAKLKLIKSFYVCRQSFLCCVRGSSRPRNTLQDKIATVLVIVDNSF